MAHQISEVSGRAEIAYAGETPWHGLGVKVDGLQTAADMLRHAVWSGESVCSRSVARTGALSTGFASQFARIATSFWAL